MGRFTWSRAILALLIPVAASVGAQTPTPTGSYMKVPRIHFSGDFSCDVSTVNNNPLNYQPEVTDPEPWWNPDGTHVIEFLDCVVTAVYDDEGAFVHQPGVDPIAGAAVESSRAVLVDLDTDQQGVSMFFGFSVSLVIPMPGGSTLTVGGPMDPAGLNGLWWQVMSTMAGRNGGDFNASASYQSVLRIPASDWPARSASPVLDAMRAACDTDADGNIMVLIAFTTNAYQNNSVNSAFKIGRVTGTLAPRKAHEPIHTPGQRWLEPREWDKKDPHQVAYNPDPKAPKQQRWDYQTFNGGPFFVDEVRKRLVVDLGNSIPINRAPNQATNDGTYFDVSAVSGVSAFVVHDGTRTELGRVDVSAFCQLETAGISEVVLTDEQIRLLHDHPLQLQAARINSGSPVILAEDPTGIAFAVTDRVFRMANDIAVADTPVLGTFKRTTSAVLVTEWGRPKAGVSLRTKGTDLHTGDSVANGGSLQWDVMPSDASGLASVTLDAIADPGDRTTELDGQVYSIEFFTDEAPPEGVDLRLRHGTRPEPTSYNEPSQERTISVHQYSNYDILAKPSWGDIEPIMSPYAKLYPAMRERIDLSIEDTFIFYSLQPPGGTPPLPLFLSAPFGVTGYMPITRDLSPNKHSTVMNYIKNLSAAAAEESR